MHIRNTIINANDDKLHHVYWDASKRTWSLYNVEGHVKDCYHLCEALTTMHWRTAYHLSDNDYRDLLVQKWTFN